MAVAGALRTHCRTDAALGWYERYFAPQDKDLRWSTCRVLRPSPNDPPEQPPTRGRGRDRAAQAGRGPTRATADTAARLGRRGGTGDACCDTGVGSAAEARRRSVLLAYLETLLESARAALCGDSAEAHALARLRLDAAARYLGPRPVTIRGDDASAPSTVAAFVARLAPLNPRLMELYDSLDDNLAALRHCLGKSRLAAPAPAAGSWWGESGMRRGWREPVEDCDDDGCCCPPGPYRFLFLLGRALETANEVRSFGAALLAAYEKGDAEFPAALRAGHERQLLNLSEELRRTEFRQADWQVQALMKSKEAAQTRRQYYADLVAGGLIAREQSYQFLTQAAMATRTAGNVVEGVSQAMNLIPDMTTGVAGVASTPVSVFQMPIGTKLAHAFAAAARILLTVADVQGTQSGLALTESGWDRREVDWLFQISVLDVEIEALERQILALERTRDGALRQLNNLVQQKQQAAELQDFLRDKFTNHALYLFLQRETAALHQRMYDIARCWALQAQRAYRLEREFNTRTFLPADTRDGLHEGLLAGERLATALRGMEKAYHDGNGRTLELSTRLSLRVDFPLAFLELKTTGRCEIAIPEWRFDREYPGHYMRRIRSVSLTIPCVAGPNTGVHCKLTLLGSATRVEPTLLDIEDCCPRECTCGCCAGRRYEAQPDDPRIVRRCGATESIATSHAQNDAGLFELNFRDERYLPFEYAGLVSLWRFELPAETNAFDTDTVTEVDCKFDYTAWEGGSVLREASWAAASNMLPGGGLRYFDWARDFSDAWHRFTAGFLADRRELCARRLALRMHRGMFPYLPGQRPVRMRRPEIWFEARTCEEGVRNVELEFVPDRDLPCGDDGETCCERYQLTCVASADWPCLFHGVLDYPFPYLEEDCARQIGEFVFPETVSAVRKAYLVCSYEAGAPQRCLAPADVCPEGCRTPC
ncbi:hypothetical protein [Massilia sp. Se16.2.3]|uniref:Tc toxin subunit A-related protein n=1 Tax=Massilia sp. Se16.2.3 TaxID=2709303 RepID=UPI001600C8B9|nr:hypothetical protein [Massilia sp. Se16.2.3]QNB00114.1 hypothetical protein G4G31_16965 [Massilia sp. Se16.2.3]